MDITENSSQLDSSINTALSLDLDGLDAFLIKQEVETMEAISGFETSNSYLVLGAANGSAVMQWAAVEQSSFLARLFCGNRRPFTLRVVRVPLNPNMTARSSLLGMEIDPRLLSAPADLLIERPLRLCSSQLVNVVDGRTRSLLGVVRCELCRLVDRDLTVMLSDGTNLTPVVRIHCGFGLENLIKPRWRFEILDATTAELKLGTVQKHFSGIVQELTTDADNFGVQLLQTLPANVKALVLAAVFLIDFMYFEDNDANSSSRRQRRRRY